MVWKTFDKAFNLRGCPDNLTFHSDQGVQYTAYKFRKHLYDLGVKQSFSNPGFPLDNAVAEAFFSIMKREELSIIFIPQRNIWKLLLQNTLTSLIIIVPIKN